MDRITIARILNAMYNEARDIQHIFEAEDPNTDLVYRYKGMAVAYMQAISMLEDDDFALRMLETYEDKIGG